LDTGMRERGGELAARASVEITLQMTLAADKEPFLDAQIHYICVKRTVPVTRRLFETLKAMLG